MENGPISNALTPVTPARTPPIDVPPQATLAVVQIGNVVQDITLVQPTVDHRIFPGDPARIDLSMPTSLANTHSASPAVKAPASDVIMSEAASTSAAGRQASLLSESFQTIDELPAEIPAAQQNTRHSSSASAYCRSAASVASQARSKKRYPVQRYTDPLDLLRASVINNPDQDAIREALKNKIIALDNLLKQRPAGELMEIADFDLRQLDFSQLKAPLNKIHFVNCRFDDARMVNMLMEHCQLTACEAGNSDWRNAVLHQCTFSSTHMHGAILHASQLIACQLIRTSLQGIQACNALLIGTTLTHCKMQRAQLTECDLSALTAEHCNLNGATLERSDLSGATLRSCKFTSATLAENSWLETTMELNTFNDATLTGAFSGANFSNNSMYAVHIAEAAFDGVILDASCTLALPEAAGQHRYFAPSDPLSVKLMRAIHSSEESGLPIKTKLMRQLVQNIELKDITLSREIATTLLKTLARLPYRQDTDINAFVIKLMPFVASANNPLTLSEELRAIRAKALNFLRNPVSQATRIRHENDNYNKMRTLKELLSQPRNGEILDLSGIDMQDMTFKELTFEKVRFEWANMRQAQFENCVFKDCSLAAVQMESCRFSRCLLNENVNITGANLSKAVFLNCDLTRIEASQTDFTDAWLYHTIASHANFSYSTFSGFMMQAGEAKGTDFSSSTILDATFENCNMNDTLMEETILHRTTFYRVELNHADLSTASLTDINLISATLFNTMLNNSLTLSLPEWSATRLTEYFNHHAQRGYSLLKTLKSISRDHLVLKIALAEQLVTSLRAASIDLTAVSVPLIDELGRPLWRQSPLIQEFNHHVIDIFLAHHAAYPLVAYKINFLSTIILNLQHNLPLAYRHQVAFAQLINQVAYSDTPEELIPRARRQVQQSIAREVYEAYLQHPLVQSTLAERNIAAKYHELKAEADWSDKQTALFLLFAMEDQPGDEEAAIPAEGVGNSLHAGGTEDAKVKDQRRTMVLSPESLTRMSHLTIPASWVNFWLFKNGAALPHGKYDTAIMLEHSFPAFYTCWQSQQKASKLERLVATLNLGDDLYQLFMDAAGQSVSIRKLTDTDSLQALDAVFLPLLQPVADSSKGECQLTADHYQTILRLYQLENASDRKKAEMLLSIGIVMIRYSGASLLGEPDNSPHILRIYGLACITQAKNLYPELFVVHFSATPAVEATDDAAARPAIEEHDEDLFPGWRERLLGLTPKQSPGDTIHCSNTLATEMLGLADTACSDTVNSIYPASWS